MEFAQISSIAHLARILLHCITLGGCTSGQVALKGGRGLSRDV
jgi:hypothetical protein